MVRPRSGRTTTVDLLHRWATEADALSDQEAAENTVVLRSLDAHRHLFPDLVEKWG